MSANNSTQVLAFRAALRTEWWFLFTIAVAALGATIFTKTSWATTMLVAIYAAGLSSAIWTFAITIKHRVAAGYSGEYYQKSKQPHWYWANVCWLGALIIALVFNCINN